jgi:hypothetical protein
MVYFAFFVDVGPAAFIKHANDNPRSTTKPTEQRNTDDNNDS